jgi:hypothetical protein
LVLEDHDFRALTHFSRALWAEADRSFTRAQDTVAAVSLLDLEGHEATDRAVTALLHQAAKDGPEINRNALNHPFYRLTAEERLILSALHVGGFNYDRLSRVLGVTRERLGEMAWYARIQLAHSLHVTYPTGSPHRGSHCPVYEARNPWTQRFLDEEIQGSERLFLQNHMMACGHCRAALTSCRNLYFQIEESIPRVKGGGQLQSIVNALSRAAYETETTAHPWKHRFKGSLRAFVRHRDVQLVLGIFVVISMWKLFG